MMTKVPEREGKVTIDAADLAFLLNHPAIEMHNPCQHFWTGCGETKNVAARLTAALIALPVDDLNIRVKNLLAKHFKAYRTTGDEVWDRNPVCDYCQHAWPCDIFEELGGILPGPEVPQSG